MNNKPANAHGWLEALGKALEPVMLVMGVVSPLATIPQILKLYGSQSHHAVGLSLTTWVMYSLIACLWTIYGFYHRNPTIWVGNGLGFFMYLTMVAGIYMHTGGTW
ncbi:SemiSWEET transporter [Parendozoicomonas haliclonae]|uniref:MtN3/saliva family protein n=1 Tax=Parendozoicomonas haliclonae TaxID=1960125 RepID=A0A1X7AQ31_9GAMM|nr:SemiSWEET transporter [Parendozoicomonas haliclonae]SMA50431.1 MtN3/saliva family protein [Parendozoicomonas haliclonae]